MKVTVHRSRGGDWFRDCTRARHACSPSSLVTLSADTFLRNLFPPLDRYRESLEKVTHKAIAVADHIHPRGRNGRCRVRDFFLSANVRAAAPPLSDRWLDRVARGGRHRRSLFSDLIFNREHMPRQEPPSYYITLSTWWKEVWEVCATTAPSSNLHRNEALPAFILDSTITSRLYPVFFFSFFSFERARHNVAP